MQALSEAQAVMGAALLLGPVLPVPSFSLQHVTAPVGFWALRLTAPLAPKCLPPCPPPRR